MEIRSARSILVFLLRFFGAMSVAALLFVAVPYSWMNSIHSWLGLRQMPDSPIVGYLARSLSAFYALLGGVAIVASFDIERHRLLLTYLGISVSFMGVVLLCVDIVEQLPVLWIIAEGPFIILFGFVMLYLLHAIKPTE